MEAQITIEDLDRLKHRYLEEICGSCTIRLPGMYCPGQGRVMPDYCPACRSWEGSDD